MRLCLSFILMMRINSFLKKIFIISLFSNRFEWIKEEWERMKMSRSNRHGLDCST